MIESLSALLFALNALHTTLDTVDPYAIVPVIPIEQELTTEEIVKEVFRDDPIMVAISKCESGMRQFDANGNVVKGARDKRDTGIFQINTYYHGEEAKRLGHDITTLEGNLAYAKTLYEKEGTRPWNASKKECWGKAYPNGQV